MNIKRLKALAEFDGIEFTEEQIEWLEQFLKTEGGIYEH